MPEIKRLDVKVRKLLTINKMHHSKADVDRLYIRRSDGGKGLLQLELMYRTTTIGLQTYLDSTQDWMPKPKRSILLAVKDENLRLS